jgi:hypothetical protein
MIILLTGCTKDKYFTCKIDLNNELMEYNLNAIYKVYYEDSYVTRIEKNEIYETENKETLNYFNEYKSLEYMNLSNLYGGIVYTVDLKENKVILDATFGMSVVDIKEMIKNKHIDRDYVIGNNLTVGGIKNIYREKGAICDI